MAGCKDWPCAATSRRQRQFGLDKRGKPTVAIHGGHGQIFQVGHGGVQTIARRNGFGLLLDILALNHQFGQY